MIGSDEIKTKTAEFEFLTEGIARWRWSHDERWLRLVGRYVELRRDLHDSNALIVVDMSIIASVLRRKENYRE